MNHRKFVEVLQALSSEQIESLSDFIRSPYFNKNGSLPALYDYFKKLHPEYPSHAVNTEAILNSVAGIEDENVLAKMLTRLLDLAGRFLSMEYAHDPTIEKIGTLKAYKKLRLNKHFSSLATQLKKELHTNSFHDFDHAWRAHRLEEECFEGFDKRLMRTSENTLDQVIGSLSRFYSTKKIRYMAEAIYRERLLGIEISKELKKETALFLEQVKYNDDLYLSLYANIYLMNLERLPEKAIPYYTRVKANFRAFQPLIPKEEMRSICVYLQNFCIKLINKEDKIHLKEYIKIIQFRIDYELLLEDTKMHPQLFKNITVAALKLNNFSWCHSFIKKFGKHLPISFRTDYYNYALGELYYHKKEYAKALHYLAFVGHNKMDIYFGFAVKKLLLKIGFESGDIFLLAPFTATYKKHLERYQLKIGHNAIILQRFFKYFRALVNANGNSEKLENLSRQLQCEENFTDKDWIIKMIETQVTTSATSISTTT